MIDLLATSFREYGILLLYVKYIHVETYIVIFSVYIDLQY